MPESDAHSPKRYTSGPFPRYAHRPGRTPHPATDPDGHSFGAPPAPVLTPPAPERWRECAAYLSGVDLYNHGFWWEAHEAWEALWRGLPSEADQARFLRGLIQVAAARLKVEAGERAGAARLAARARENLGPVLDHAGSVSGARFMGLDVRAWWESVEAYVAGRSDEPPMIVLE